MILFLHLLLTTALVQNSVEPPDDSQLWLRRASSEDKISLEIVSRKFVSEGKPDIWLVGVAHVADSSFYEEITNLLDKMDIVLYESVRPAGSRKPGGNSDEDRVNSTQKSLEFVADVAKKCSEDSEELPESLEDVIVEASLIDRRLSSWIEDASVDAWGRPFSLHVDPEEKQITFWSFGSDGVYGGEGSATDLTATRTVSSNRGVTEESGQGPQQELAVALNLEFQLDVLSYEEPNWFCSDLTIDEVEAKLKDLGVDDTILGTLTGEAFTAKLAIGMMRLIPMLDSITGGGVSETARLLMIEMMSMPEAELILKNVEPDLAQVIIVDRNTELLGDIETTIKLTDDIKTIGVLYGAGHMSDLSPRLKSMFGYVPVEDVWVTALSVNPSKTLLDESYMKRLRFMLRYQLNKANQKKTEKESSKESSN
ncbi:MAG: type II secretion system protein GspG [Phycisphaerales bacterium]|jgi:hypothetical protein|nr:type II secretion system protein GspG [Phycisphaerales bacterium]